jgi:hypothetical protein
MGTPTTNTLSGNTNGTIITYDYTSDFATLATRLETIATNLQSINTSLGTLNTNMVTFNTSFNSALGPTSAATTGTVGYSTDSMVGWISGINDTLARMWDQQGKIASAIGQVHLATSSVGSAVQESVAVQQIVAADQMSTNEFNKTATKDALERNGIPAPQPRSAVEVVREKVTEATSINATSEVVAFADEKITKGVNVAANYGADLFASTAAGRYLSGKWTAFTDYLNEPIATADKVKVEETKTLAQIGNTTRRAKA